MNEREHDPATEPFAGLNDPYDGDPDTALPPDELESLRATLRTSEPSIHDDLWTQMLRRATDPSTPDPGSLLVDGIDASGTSGGPFDLGTDDRGVAGDVGADVSDDAIAAAPAPGADRHDTTHGYDPTQEDDPYSDDADAEVASWPVTPGDIPSDLEWHRDGSDDETPEP